MERKSKEEVPATEIAKSAPKKDSPKVETSSPIRERHPYIAVSPYGPSWIHRTNRFKQIRRFIYR